MATLRRVLTHMISPSTDKITYDKITPLRAYDTVSVQQTTAQRANVHAAHPNAAAQQ